MSSDTARGLVHATCFGALISSQMKGVIKVAAAAQCTAPKKKCLFPLQGLAHCSCHSSCWLPAQESHVLSSQELLPALHCSATGFLNSHFVSPVPHSPSVKRGGFYFSHRDVMGTFKAFESHSQFFRWQQNNAHWCNGQEIQGCWLASSHESVFPKLCNKLHHSISSGHWRVNENFLMYYTWMKLPASSDMIIFISESFWTVLGWTESHRGRGLFSTSLFFPGAALFPRGWMGRTKPFQALGVSSSPSRVPAHLSCLLQLGDLGSYRRARDESDSMLGFCSVWLPERKYWITQPNFFVVVLNLPTRSGTETINSFHWRSRSQLKSAIATSASTRFLPTESAVLALMGMKVLVLWCERGIFLFRKQGEDLP